MPHISSGYAMMKSSVANVVITIFLNTAMINKTNLLQRTAKYVKSIYPSIYISLTCHFCMLVLAVLPFIILMLSVNLRIGITLTCLQ